MLSRNRAISCIVVLLLGFLILASATSFSSSAEEFAIAPETSHNLRLSLAGGVLNAGNQMYVTSGKQLASGMILGNNVDVVSSHFTFVSHARVTGLETKGQASLELNGLTTSGERVHLVAEIDLSSMVPAASFPPGCVINCTSAIPALFVGEGHVSIRLGNHMSEKMLQMVVESAYLNPFGGPIVLASTDGSILLVAGYDHATISWRGVQTGGILAGLYKGKPVDGQFSMRVDSKEDLVAGVERDSGLVSFLAMSKEKLDSDGFFGGVSVIPTAGEIACWQYFGLPAGTCELTGLNSTGALELHGEGVSISGLYQTVWAIPAIGFTSTVIASVSKP
jgi:hypothetical protein